MKKNKPNPENHPPRRSGNRLLQLKAESRQIAYIKADGVYSIVQYRNGKRDWICYTLAKCEKALQKGMFIRCHRSYLINVYYISKVDLKKQYAITLRKGKKIDISRRRRNKVATAPAVKRKAT